MKKGTVNGKHFRSLFAFSIFNFQFSISPWPLSAAKILGGTTVREWIFYAPLLCPDASLRSA
jgi:hypothetical protein